MRAIFIKELRQGRPLLVFSLLIGLLIPLLYVVLLRANPFYRVQRDIIDGTFHHLCLVVPPIIAFFAGCGLFAGEVDRGTAPILFGLPVSRRRIWAAKVLAGLALTAVGSAVSLALVRLFLPSVFRAAPFSAYLPDVVLWTAFAVAVAVFCSTITRHANAALALAAILAGALAAGAIALWYYLDAPLLGYDEALDIALWCFSAVPALLLASALVVTRGELLQSRRIWAIASASLAITIGLSVLLVTGSARWLTRYDRSTVAAALAGPPAGRFAEVTAVAGPIPWLREFGKGWMPRTLESLQGIAYRARRDSHRRNYGLILDLETGQEALVQRIGSEEGWGFHAALSPDGRLAAVITEASGLTWGTRADWGNEKHVVLRIHDMERNKLLYSGVPEAITNTSFVPYWMSWSASGEYLVLPIGMERSVLYTIRANASVLQSVRPRLESWRWAPNDDVIYGLGAEAVLYRAYPDGREAETVVSLGDKLNYGRDSWRSMWDPSPDGRWLLIHEQSRIGDDAEESSQRTGRMEEALWAVRTDGSEIRKLWGTGPQEGDVKGRVRSAAWTPDGATLYLATYNDDEKSSNVLRWTPSDVSPLPVFTGLAGQVRLLARPDSDEIIVWRWRRGGPGQPWYQATEGAVLLLDGEGQVRELLSPETTTDLATHYFPVGFGPDGRVVLQRQDTRQGVAGVDLLDIETGEIQQLYP